jgi:Domain of unknown function (DUF4943)
MKMKFFSCLVVVNLLVASCQDSFDLKNPNVDEFVSLLKNGSYLDKVGYELPDFKINHIDKLLLYSRDTSVVKFFPSNPISSKRTAPKILSECVLWTIEGIRLRSKYPSLEPNLIDTVMYSPFTGYPRLSGKKLLRVSDIYTNWYNDYKSSPSDALRKKEILKGTSYKWN